MWQVLHFSVAFRFIRPALRFPVNSIFFQLTHLGKWPLICVTEITSYHVIQVGPTRSFRSVHRTAGVSVWTLLFAPFGLESRVGEGTGRGGAGWGGGGERGRKSVISVSLSSTMTLNPTETEILNLKARTAQFLQVTETKVPRPKPTTFVFSSSFSLAWRPNAGDKSSRLTVSAWHDFQYFVLPEIETSSCCFN